METQEFFSGLVQLTSKQQTTQL